MALALAAMAILISASGCGGNIPERAFGTPTGTYSFSIVAAAGTTVPPLAPPCIVPQSSPIAVVSYPCTVMPQPITLTVN
jgi:hypothetical protein